MRMIGPHSNGPASLPYAARGNAAYAYAGVGDLLSSIGEWAAPQYAESANAVLLMAGARDLLNDVPASHILMRYGQLLGAMTRAFGKDTRIFVSNVLDLTTVQAPPGVRHEWATLNAQLPAFVSYFRNKGLNVRFVDMVSMTQLCPESPRNNTLCCISDNVHPSSSGYARLALAWSRVLQMSHPSRPGHSGNDDAAGVTEAEGKGESEEETEDAAFARLISGGGSGRDGRVAEKEEGAEPSAAVVVVEEDVEEERRDGARPDDE